MVIIYKTALFATLSILLLLMNFAEGGAVSSDEFVNLSDEVLIELAIKSVKEKSFDAEDFDEVTVTRRKDSLFVTFAMNYIYVPMQSKAIYGIGVDLQNKQKVWDLESNPQGYATETEPVVFRHTQESKRIIEMVEKHIPSPCKGDCKVIIMEQEDYYHVTEIREDFEASFKMEKESGRVYDEGHSDLIPDPEEEEDEDNR